MIVKNKLIHSCMSSIQRVVLAKDKIIYAHTPAFCQKFLENIILTLILFFTLSWKKAVSNECNSCQDTSVQSFSLHPIQSICYKEGIVQKHYKKHLSASDLW